MKSQQEIRSQVGQLLIMGFDGTEMTAHLRQFIAGIQPGGIILFRRNIVGGTQCFDLLSECRKAVLTPVLSCVDLEGGIVDRFRDLIAPAPSEFEVASTKSKKLFRRHGEILGAEARALGFNTDFAPVSDLRFPVSQAVLGSRTVSEDPKETVAYVREFLKGLKTSGVLGCGKHFPGLGEADLDTHHLLPTLNKPWKKLWNEDLMPYRTLHKRFPFVMVAHAAYPAVTKDNTPASLSRKWMTDVLRKKIGYRGLILTDDLEMGGVLAAAPMGEAAVRTLRAGADMFLVCHKEDYVIEAYEAVVREAERDKKFAKIVAQAAARALAFKKKAPELKKAAARPTEKTIQKLRAELEKFKQQVAKAQSK
ncbi:MAG: Beta-N-acetylhexosaminidase [Acidobacteriaceae bacterium]|nr:Beta-N-acetylhexosaminidase [Acidobacteriaceae bacterium]